jgi:hypothetical protein
MDERLRSEPAISKPPTANVIGQMPDGHPVRAVTGTPVKGFVEAETSLDGALLRGFASARFLVADAQPRALIEQIRRGADRQHHCRDARE